MGAAFFYGTLMAPPVLHRVIHGSATPSAAQAKKLTVRPALLPHFTRRRVRHADYPAIISTPSDPDSCVRGTYVLGLTTSDLWRLDIFEGDEYKRQKVKVKLLDDQVDETGVESRGEGQAAMEQEVEADTYIWIAGEDRLESTEWDFSEFQKEKMGRWVGSGEEYEEVDDAVKAQTNDPTGGRGANGKITSQLATEWKGEKLEEAAV